MRVHVIYAHPSPTSFAAGLRHELCQTLEERGHEIDLCDLYAEKFDPVLSERSYRAYLDVGENKAEVASYVDRLRQADALVLVYPVWHDGAPAILKGYFDRVFLRGVVFEIDADGVFYPLLQNIQRLSAVATYGADRDRTRAVGDLPRRFVLRNLGPLIAQGAPVEYHGAYGMDAATAESRALFLARVKRSFRRW